MPDPIKRFDPERDSDAMLLATHLNHGEFIPAQDDSGLGAGTVPIVNFSFKGKITGDATYTIKPGDIEIEPDIVIPWDEIEMRGEGGNWVPAFTDHTIAPENITPIVWVVWANIIKQDGVLPDETEYFRGAKIYEGVEVTPLTDEEKTYMVQRLILEMTLDEGVLTSIKNTQAGNIDLAPAGDGDELVSIDGLDSTAGYLDQKLSVEEPLTKTIVTDEDTGAKTLVLGTTFDDTDELVCVDAEDIEPNYLAAKLVPGSNVEIVTLDPNSDMKKVLEVSASDEKVKVYAAQDVSLQAPRDLQTSIVDDTNEFYDIVSVEGYGACLQIPRAQSVAPDDRTIELNPTEDGAVGGALQLLNADAVPYSNVSIPSLAGPNIGGTPSSLEWIAIDGEQSDTPEAKSIEVRLREAAPTKMLQLYGFHGAEGAEAEDEDLMIYRSTGSTYPSVAYMSKPQTQHFLQIVTATRMNFDSTTLQPGYFWYLSSVTIEDDDGTWTMVFNMTQACLSMEAQAAPGSE